MRHTNVKVLILPTYANIINDILATDEAKVIENDPLLNNTLSSGSGGMSHIIMTALIKL